MAGWAFAFLGEEVWHLCADLPEIVKSFNWWWVGALFLGGMIGTGVIGAGIGERVGSWIGGVKNRS
jgi:hypothetical protein